MANEYLQLLETDSTDPTRAYSSWNGSSNLSDNILSYSTDYLGAYWGTPANPIAALSPFVNVSTFAALGLIKGVIIKGVNQRGHNQRGQIKLKWQDYRA